MSVGSDIFENEIISLGNIYPFHGKCYITVSFIRSFRMKIILVMLHISKS